MWPNDALLCHRTRSKFVHVTAYPAPVPCSEDKMGKYQAQAQNGVNLEFWVNFFHKVKAYRSKKNRDLNQGILRFRFKWGGPSLNGTSKWLTHRLTDTDAGNDNTRWPKLASGENKNIGTSSRDQDLTVGSGVYRPDVPENHYTDSILTNKMPFYIHYNMVRWISAPGTMDFRPRYDTFWTCGLFTLLQFCKHPPPSPNHHETEMSK